MSETRETRLKRLRFRSWHRGMREVDLLLGGFADRHLTELDPAQLERYEQLLGAADPELYDWIARRTAAPAAYECDVLNLIRNFINS